MPANKMPICICTTCKPRQTKQRTIILEEIRTVKTHPTADEIFSMVKKRLPGISLATVYRNLDFLEKEGEILKLKHKNNEQKAHYDGFPTLHYHLICKECGQIQDIDDCGCVLLDNKKMSKKYSFEIDPNTIEIMGLCKKCKNSNQ
ncbi:transcriptional repressor [Candidatus Peregrinibacteria bacterium]|jgi:Fur family transcriptional regulator, ferric uptake regulator|nr:transcriptional repressor [Candidatus Peregrinibacteria bacterium]MBT4147958.1 transcriptional repressor [Candidatus Peregrinibacteria bacterium]MBT4365992.1 transcriptional repressor [Candidatus Peregrinibacteria bacterium]MBT4456617.1 transcriptional repressor [Candidatus Peregrinibacteria bacterium]